MSKLTVKITVDNGLCTSCGVCKGICPKRSIEYEKEGGMFLPKIDNSTCIGCGLCYKVCPAHGYSYSDEPTEPKMACRGEFLDVYNARCRDENLLKVSASGGVVTTVIRELLCEGLYSCAFLVDGYRCDGQYKSEKKTVSDLLQPAENISTVKSRYLPVSHENAVSYITEKPNERVILVGTSCALRALSNVISCRGLCRDNYLFIGLFCDKVFNYNVFDYFSSRFGEGKKLSALHFKNKESGGWPGNMKLFFENGDTSFVNKSEREFAKDFFMPESCLYCIDKLNVSADISLGDNYTDKYCSDKGSNSVIIRTNRGIAAFSAASEKIYSNKIDISDVEMAQATDYRCENIYYGCLKKKKNDGILLNENVALEYDPRMFADRYKSKLKKISLGKNFSGDPNAILSYAKREKRKANSKFISFLRRAKGYLTRKFYG